MYVFHFLNEILHDYIDLTPNSLRLLFEVSEQLVPQNHLLLN